MDLRLSLEEQKILAKDACKGDKQAQDRIYTAYHKALFGYLRARAMQDVDAENISQEVWTQLLAERTICKYDPLYALYTFLRIVAHSRLVDYYRKKKPVLVPILEYEILDDQPSDGENASRNKDCQDFIDLSSIALPQTDTAEELASAYKIVLEYLFRNGGNPHQLIVFAFAKLVDHWKPQKIISELSSTPLGQLCDRLHKDYLVESNLPEEEIASGFSYLEQQMGLLVGEIITDSVLRDKLKPCLNKPVGQTILRDYYGKDASHSISDWCDKVKKRLERGREEIIS